MTKYAEAVNYFAVRCENITTTIRHTDILK